MTVVNYRYQRQGPVQQTLRDLCGTTTTVVSSDGGHIITISQDDASDDPVDLHEQMSVLGYTLIATDPTDNDEDAFTPKSGRGTGGSVSAGYRFSSTTTAADPGAGNLRFNNAAYASITEVYVDDLAASPTFDMGLIFATLNVGDIIIVQQNDDATRAVELTITSITDETGWWRFGVSYVQDAGGSMLQNNRACTLAFVFESSHIKHNTTATTDPGTGDDANDGYEALSHWINTTSDEVFVCADPSVGAAVWASITDGGGGGGSLPEFGGNLDHQDLTLTADWAISSHAPIIQDPTNSGIHCARFDDTVEQGVGMTFTVPASGATNMQIITAVRAQTAPGSAEGVRIAMRFRALTDNAAVGSWSGASERTVSIPTNAFYQIDSFSNTLAGWGVSAGVTYQMQLTRDTADAADTLLGNALMRRLRITFT